MPHLNGVALEDLTVSVMPELFTELLTRAMRGVDLAAPDASWCVFVNLVDMMPWRILLEWNLFFLLGGVLLGWWRRRLGEGVAWALLLGPFGWLVMLLRKRRSRPPPLP